MNPDKKKSLEAMRTFARDLERERGTSTDADKGKDKKPGEEIIETAKLAPAKSRVSSKPKPVPKKEKSKKKKREEKPIPKPKKKEKPIKDKNPEPKRIPAFHELQKVIQTDIDATTKKKVPIAKKVKGIEPTKPVAGGTVITDTKNKKRHFFTELTDSFKKWVAGIKKSLKPKKGNTYEVSQINRRKGVVQKATSKTGTIFSADNETLREQIKARQRAEKHDHDDEDLSWSPYTEPGYPLLEGDEAESVDPRVKKVSIVQKTHAAPKPVIKSTDKIPELYEKKEEATLEAIIEESGDELPPEPVAKPKPQKPEPPKPKPQKETKPKPVEVEVEVEVEKPPAETGSIEMEEIETEPEPIPIIERLKNFSLEDTNTLAMLLVGIVLAIAIFGFVLFGIFNVGDKNQSDEVIIPEQAIYTGATLDSITLDNRSFNEILTKTNSTLLEEEGSETTEYRYAHGNNGALSSDVVMHLIQTDANDGFANTVTAVGFVKTSDRNRGIVLRATSETVTRGGMLNWELTLLSDVGDLLNLPSVPPNAGEFVDIQFKNHDVRALMFDNKPLLVYAIVNESDVIIASELSMLAAFVEN